MLTNLVRSPTEAMSDELQVSDPTEPLELFSTRSCFVRQAIGNRSSHHVVFIRGTDDTLPGHQPPTAL